MPSYNCDGHRVVTSHRTLSDYMPGLAVSLVARFGFSPGEKFLSDVFNVLKEDPTAFPADIGTYARRMRLDRLLDTPIQVDDLVLTLKSDVRERKYQKIKRLVVTHGSLPSDTTQHERPGVKYGASENIPVKTYADPAVVAYDPASGDPVLFRRMDALEKAHAEFRADVYTQLSLFGQLLSDHGVSPQALADSNSRYEIAGNLDILRRRFDAFEATYMLGDMHPAAPPAAAQLGPQLNPAAVTQLGPQFHPTSPTSPAPTPPAPTPTFTLPPFLGPCDPRLEWPSGDAQNWPEHLDRPRFVLRVEQHEADLAAVLRAQGRPVPALDAVVEPAWSKEDCAARITRIREILLANGHPDDPRQTRWFDPEPVGPWFNLAPRLMRIDSHLALACARVGTVMGEHPLLAAKEQSA